MMFAGFWLALPWFVLNGFALGSPTLKREAMWAAGGLLGAFVWLVSLSLGVQALGLEAGSGPYLNLILTVWKLGVAYRLYVLQAQTFEIYTYYGGKARNGLLVMVLASFLVGPKLAAVLPGWLGVVLL